MGGWRPESDRSGSNAVARRTLFALNVGSAGVSFAPSTPSTSTPWKASHCHGPAHSTHWGGFLLVAAVALRHAVSGNLRTLGASGGGGGGQPGEEIRRACLPRVTASPTRWARPHSPDGQRLGASAALVSGGPRLLAFSPSALLMPDVAKDIGAGSMPEAAGPDGLRRRPACHVNGPVAAGHSGFAVCARKTNTSILRARRVGHWPLCFSPMCPHMATGLPYSAGSPCNPPAAGARLGARRGASGLAYAIACSGVRPRACHCDG